MQQATFEGVAVGTPIAAVVGPREVGWWHLTPGVRAFGGFDSALISDLATSTDTRVTWPCTFMFFVDPDWTGSLSMVLHGWRGPGSDVQVSGLQDGLPWSRAILRTIAEVVFVQARAGSITVRARPSDLRRRQLLRRLGFVAVNREQEPGREARLIYRLFPANISRTSLRLGRLKPVKKS